MKMITVDANLFRLAYAAVSVDEMRPHLKGVHIEPHPVAGAIMVSTDGRRMVVVHDPEGVCDETKIIKLPRFALAECRVSKMFGMRRRLDIGASATITEVAPGKKATDPKTERAVLSAFGVFVEGTYPDWRRVVPEAPKGAMASEPVTFDSKYLKAFGDLGADIAKTIDGATAGMQISQPVKSLLAPIPTEEETAMTVVDLASQVVGGIVFCFFIWVLLR
jgi:hypothetical protein